MKQEQPDPSSIRHNSRAGAANKVLLFHNHSAGDGALGAEELRRAFRDEGFEVSYHSKDDGALDSGQLDEADIMVIAGGDGTVGKALVQFRDADLRFAILPLGTANNIAASLGPEVSLRQFLSGLRTGEERAFDVGLIEGLDERQVFVEAVGFGALAESLSSAHGEAASGPAKVEAGRQALRDVLQKPPLRLDLTVDGAPLSQEVHLVEILNVPISGPCLRLSPCANLGDGRLDVAYLRPERKEAFLRALEADQPLPLDIVQGQRVEVSWRGEPLRADDDFPQPPERDRRLSITLSDAPVRMIVPSRQSNEGSET